MNFSVHLPLLKYLKSRGEQKPEFMWLNKTQTLIQMNDIVKNLNANFYDAICSRIFIEASLIPKLALIFFFFKQRGFERRFAQDSFLDLK